MSDKSDRRQFLTSTTVTTTAMAGGLATGYGAFFCLAGQYLYPSGKENAWMFVAVADELAPGDARTFQSPSGLPVVVTRLAARSTDSPPRTEDFLALSSVCPHFGCRVHWEAHNQRFFCPCHNGAFDAQGKAIAGPPLADNQNLPTYSLLVEKGLLYIAMPIQSLVTTKERKG